MKASFYIITTVPMSLGFFGQGDNSAARATIKPVIKTRWEYFLLYLLLLFPLPRSIFMRLIFKR